MSLYTPSVERHESRYFLDKKVDTSISIIIFGQKNETNLLMVSF